MKKKLIASALSVMMLFSAFGGMTVFAADAETKKITVGDGKPVPFSGESGDTKFTRSVMLRYSKEDHMEKTVTLCSEVGKPNNSTFEIADYEYCVLDIETVTTDLISGAKTTAYSAMYLTANDTWKNVGGTLSSGYTAAYGFLPAFTPTNRNFKKYEYNPMNFGGGKMTFKNTSTGEEITADMTSGGAFKNIVIGGNEVSGKSLAIPLKDSSCYKDWTWHLDASKSISDSREVIASYDGAFCAETPYITNYEIYSQATGKDDGDNLFCHIDLLGTTLTAPSDQYLTPSKAYDKSQPHGDAYIYKVSSKNTSPVSIVQKIAAKNFTMTSGYMVNGGKKNNDDYYLRLFSEDGKDAWFYKANKETGIWDFRCQASATDISMEVSPKNFGGYYGGEASVVVKEENTTSKETLVTATSDEFMSGAKSFRLNYTEKPNLFYTVTLGDTAKGIIYSYIGVDSVASIKGKLDYAVVPFIIHNSDAATPVPVYIHGFTEDGAVFNTTMNTVDAKALGDGIALPDGTYTAECQFTQYSAQFTVDKDDSEKVKGSYGENGVPNGLGYENIPNSEINVKEIAVDLSKLKETRPYVITAPDGTVLEEGVLPENGEIKGADDIKLTKKQLSGYPYVIYKYDVLDNRIGGEPMHFTGYLILDANGNVTEVISKEIKLGDVNCDGKVTAADAVMLQKWLTTEGTLEIKNAIGADMDKNGKLNAVDLSLLKRLLLNA